MRRLRQKEWIRDLVQESSLSTKDLVWPLFLHDNLDDDRNFPIATMPGVLRYSLKNIGKTAQRAFDLGIPAVALFPQISTQRKDSLGSEALNPNNIICAAIREIKEKAPKLGVICDVALDPYTDHGHDGVLLNGQVENDRTVEILCEQALVQARAGCDVIAPSDMMDGRIGRIREHLENNNFQHVLILAYAAKYASAFYGPFRDAIGSSSLVGTDKAIGFRDKRGYQMNPANSREAMREIQLDIEEGADMVMIKPGLPYLDIIYQASQAFDVPIFAYQVSGEYSSLMHAAQSGLMDETRAMMESLLSFKRAGTTGILTYYADRAAEFLNAS